MRGEKKKKAKAKKGARAVGPAAEAPGPSGPESRRCSGKLQALFRPLKRPTARGLLGLPGTRGAKGADGDEGSRPVPYHHWPLTRGPHGPLVR
jgi:hypothetical protein